MADAAKGAKIGRGTRAPGSSGQKGRTERNKAKSLKRNPAGAEGVNRCAGMSQHKQGQPTRMSRMPSIWKLADAKKDRISIQRAISRA